MQDNIKRRFQELGLVDKPKEPVAVRVTGDGVNLHHLQELYDENNNRVGWITEISSIVNDSTLESLSGIRGRYDVNCDKIITQCVLNVNNEDISGLVGKKLYKMSPERQCIGRLVSTETQMNDINGEMIIRGRVEWTEDMGIDVVEISEDLIENPTNRVPHGEVESDTSPQSAPDMPGDILTGAPLTSDLSSSLFTGAPHRTTEPVTGAPESDVVNDLGRRGQRSNAEMIALRRRNIGARETVLGIQPITRRTYTRQPLSGNQPTEEQAQALREMPSDEVARRMEDAIVGRVPNRPEPQNEDRDDLAYRQMEESEERGQEIHNRVEEANRFREEAQRLRAMSTRTRNEAEELIETANEDLRGILGEIQDLENRLNEGGMNDSQRAESELALSGLRGSVSGAMERLINIQPSVSQSIGRGIRSPVFNQTAQESLRQEEEIRRELEQIISLINSAFPFSGEPEDRQDRIRMMRDRTNLEAYILNIARSISMQSLITLTDALGMIRRAIASGQYAGYFSENVFDSLDMISERLFRHGEHNSAMVAAANEITSPLTSDITLYQNSDFIYIDNEVAPQSSDIVDAVALAMCAVVQPNSNEHSEHGAAYEIRMEVQKNCSLSKPPVGQIVNPCG